MDEIIEYAWALEAVASTQAGAVIEYAWELEAKPDRMPGYTIVLARRSEFSPADGAPTHWKPAAGYGWGTAAVSRDIGFGDVLTHDFVDQSAPDLTQSATGRNLFGAIPEGTAMVETLCIVDLLDPEERPAKGDLYTVEGRQYVVWKITLHNEEGTSRHMTLSGIAWDGLTASRTHAGTMDLTLST